MIEMMLNQVMTISGNEWYKHVTISNQGQWKTSRLPERVLWQATWSSGIFTWQILTTAFTYPLYQHKQISLYVGTATWDKETGGKHLAERAERRETHWQVVWSLHHQLQPWKRCIWAEKFKWQASKEESRLKVSCLKHLPHVRIEGNLYVHTTGKWKGLNIKRLTTAHLFAFFHFYL